MVRETKPKTEGNYLRAAMRTIVRSTPIGAVIAAGLTPTRMGSGDLSEANTLADIEYDKAMKGDNNPFGQVAAPPPQMVYIKPNGQSAVLLPSAEPDTFTPWRGPYEIWNDPMIDLDYVLPDQLPYAQPRRIDDPVATPLGQPLRGPQPATSPRPGRTRVRPRPGARTMDRPGRAVDLKIEFSPQGEMRVRNRKARAPRWNRRRKDTKLKRWYLWALHAIDRTWGTVDEVIQFGEAVAWNTYTEDGRLAMNVEGRNQLAVFKGIGEGRYTLDPIGAATDYALSQTMDAVIAKGMRHTQKGLNEAGWSFPTGIGTGPAI